MNTEQESTVLVTDFGCHFNNLSFGYKLGREFLSICGFNVFHEDKSNRRRSCRKLDFITVFQLVEISGPEIDFDSSKNTLQRIKYDDLSSKNHYEKN